MRYARLLSLVLFGLAFALLAVSFRTSASDDTASAIRYVSVNLIFLAWLSFLFARSNSDLTKKAMSAAHFAGMALATIGFVAVSFYLIAGMPEKIGEGLIVSIIIVALPAGLIVPVVAKGIQQKWSRVQ